jgi:hypothetical protein
MSAVMGCYFENLPDEQGTVGERRRTGASRIREVKSCESSVIATISPQPVYIQYCCNILTDSSGPAQNSEIPS